MIYLFHLLITRNVIQLTICSSSLYGIKYDAEILAQLDNGWN